jgi:hypothetical protein
VPRSWASAAPVPPDILGALFVPPKDKLPGWYGLGLGLLFAVPLWVLPGVSLFARLALTMLGSALIAEGLGRLRLEARKRGRRLVDILEPPERMAEGVDALGSLRAVFQTAPERRMEALAIALFGLAFAFGAGYLVELLRAGFVSPKLMLAAFAAPCAAAYTLYRAGRYLVDRWCVLIFAEGFVCLHGRQVSVYFREDIAEISQVELGDAIDERAVDIRLKRGKAPLRFTVSQFRNLDRFGDRVRREFSRPAFRPTEGPVPAACTAELQTTTGEES